MPKKIPMRQCVGCREMKPKKELIRVVRSPEAYATMGILVVYCLKGVSLFSAPFGIPEFLACALVAVLHAWKRNSLLSIGAGTVFYMILVQMVFV